MLWSAEVVLSDVPIYLWWYGCSPTTGSMIIGFWDANGYDMVDGDISTYNQAARDTIASSEHIADYWGTDDPSPHTDNSLADFMETSKDPTGDGGTDVNNIGPGLVDFAAWDNPETSSLNESYTFDSSLNWTNELAGGGWDFDFEDLKAEIDAGRPMQLSVWVGGAEGGGHSIAALGYQDNAGMDYIAVHDTWGDGASAIDYAENVYDPVEAKMEGGLEWWPWLTDTTGDFYVRGGVDFAPAGVPEPSCIALFLTGAIFLIGKKQKTDS